MKKNLVFALLFLSFSSVNAQNKTIVGFYFGPQAYKYVLYDDSTLLKNPLIPGGMFGFRLAQEIGERVSIETGYSRFTYYGGPNMKSNNWISGSNLMITHQIPIRIKYNFPVYKHKISCSPHLGLVSSFNGDFGTESGGGISSNHEGNVYTVKYQDFTSFRKNFLLLESGVDLNFTFKNDLIFSLGLNYQSGFAKVIETDISYSINNEPERKAALISNGDNFQFLMGMSYPVSNIWQDITERKASKPQRLDKLGQSFNRRFYLKLSGGPIWRSFTETPGTANVHFKDGRYPFFYFSYANFNTGLSTGFKFFRNYIFETGVYTQYYSNHIAHNLDDEVKGRGGSRTGGSNLTEIPFRLKYNYHLPAPFTRFTVTPYFGLNILGSRVTGNYDNNRGWREINSNMDTTKYYIDNSFLRTNTAILTFTTGLGIEFYIFPNVILTLDGELTFGNKEINKIEASYLYNNKLYEGAISFRGNSKSLMLGLKFPFDFNRSPQQSEN